jgi:hypothetical protein
MTRMFRHATVSGMSIALSDRHIRCAVDSDKEKYEASHRVSGVLVREVKRARRVVPQFSSENSL